jgi:hypothetical protein
MIIRAVRSRNMPHLTIADVASRTKPMAKGKKKWIKKATADSHGQFRKKAEAAGETTREFAKGKENAPGRLGKQARLAENLMGASRKGRSPLHDHPRSNRG